MTITMISVADQKKLAADLKELWVAMVPVTPPDDYEFMRFAAQPEATARRAIARTAAKSRKIAQTGTPMSANDALRYCHSVIKHELVAPQATLQATTQTAVPA